MCPFYAAEVKTNDLFANYLTLDLFEKQKEGEKQDKEMHSMQTNQIHHTFTSAIV